MADGGDLKGAFESWCVDGKSKLQRKEFGKWCKQAGIKDTNSIDIAVSACLKERKNKNELEFEDLKAIFEKLKIKDPEGMFGKNKKEEATGPKVAKGGAVDRLTDTKKYTGAHKERFDESGKGKGKGGRVEEVDSSGYVGNYKGKDTYDKKH